jgi:hypothetical protein
MTDLMEVLAEQAADSEVAWSLGTFGALAEFMRDADEPVVLARDDGAVSVVTPRGGLRIARHSDLRPIASESPTTESWSHRVALCLAEAQCAMSGRTAFTEVGPDREALREEDRAGVLFDLGLGALHADFHVRSSDQDVIAALRVSTGQSVFSPTSGAMKVILAADPHRVFVSRLGRIEVYQPIPPAGGSPTGPHTQIAGAWPYTLGERAVAARLDSVRALLSAASGAGPVRPAAAVSCRALRSGLRSSSTLSIRSCPAASPPRS